MYNLLQSEEFVRLEDEFPFLRRAREHFSGLKGLGCVILDIETTGLEPEYSEIIEIAALSIEKGNIEGVFNSLINIQKPLPPEIVKLTGITPEMLLDGEDKASALQKLLDFIKDTPLIAHNTEFDIPFLNHHLQNTLGVCLPNQSICTLKLSRKLLPSLSSHKLQKLAEHFNIPTPLVHRAPGDVEITYQLWMKLLELLEKHGISTLENVLKYGA